MLRRNVVGTLIPVLAACRVGSSSRAIGLDAEDGGRGTRPGKKDKWRERLAVKRIQEFCVACKVLERKGLLVQGMA